MCKHLSPYYLTSCTCLRQVNTIERKNSENRTQSKVYFDYAEVHPVLRSAKTIGNCLKNIIGIYNIYAG